MHFVLCDVCSVNNFVLYQLYVGISGHVENVIADYVPKVIITVNIEVFSPFIYWSMRCIIGVRYKFIQLEEGFFGGGGGITGYHIYISELLEC